MEVKKVENKAGYTATSCGRVGRGGNARFHTFELDHYRRTDQRTDGRTDGQSLLKSCVSATKNDKYVLNQSYKDRTRTQRQPLPVTVRSDEILRVGQQH